MVDPDWADEAVDFAAEHFPTIDRSVPIKMAEIIEIVSNTIGGSPDDLSLWTMSPIPMLGNRSPWEMLRTDDDLDVLLAYVRTYQDPPVFT